MKQLWDLEMLDNKELDDTYEDLVDNICINGERYSVKLAWKGGHGKLTTNYELCHSRLKRLNRRLNKDPKLAKEYDEVTQEQLNEGIVENSRGKSTRIHALFATSSNHQQNCRNYKAASGFWKIFQRKERSQLPERLSMCWTSTSSTLDIRCSGEIS